MSNITTPTAGPTLYLARLTLLANGTRRLTVDGFDPQTVTLSNYRVNPKAALAELGYVQLEGINWTRLAGTNDRQTTVTDLVTCSTCGAKTTVTDQGSTPGHCAGTVYWANLACGHQEMEDNSYLEA